MKQFGVFSPQSCRLNDFRVLLHCDADFECDFLLPFFCFFVLFNDKTLTQYQIFFFVIKYLTWIFFFPPPLVFESIVTEWKVSTTTLASRAHHLLAEHWVAKWTEIKLRHMSSQTLLRLILKGVAWNRLRTFQSFSMREKSSASYWVAFVRKCLGTSCLESKMCPPRRSKFYEGRSLNSGINYSKYNWSQWASLFWKGRLKEKRFKPIGSAISFSWRLGGIPKP